MHRTGKFTLSIGSLVWTIAIKSDEDPGAVDELMDLVHSEVTKLVASRLLALLEPAITNPTMPNDGSGSYTVESDITYRDLTVDFVVTIGEAYKLTDFERMRVVDIILILMRDRVHELMEANGLIARMEEKPPKKQDGRPEMGDTAGDEGPTPEKEQDRTPSPVVLRAWGGYWPV